MVIPSENSIYFSKLYNKVTSINTFNEMIKAFVNPHLTTEVIQPIDLHLKQFVDLNKPNWSKSKFEKFNNANLLQQFITAFDMYLKDIISFLFKKFPNMLKIKTVNYTDFQKGISNDEVIDKQIDKQAHDLLYKNYKDQMKIFNKKFKIGINVGDEIIKIYEIKLIRDIHIHDDGKVNSITLRKSNNKNYKLNEYVEISETILNETLELILYICLELDENLIKKFPDIIDTTFDLDFLSSLSKQAIEPMKSYVKDAMDEYDDKMKGRKDEGA